MRANQLGVEIFFFRSVMLFGQLLSDSQSLSAVESLIILLDRGCVVGCSVKLRLEISNEVVAVLKAMTKSLSKAFKFLVSESK